MVASFHPPKPLPADPLGQQLCALFGRQTWDFIEAPTPDPGEKAQWKTVKDYPLRPRVLWQQWQNPHQLIGVRFTDQTVYALLDMDAESPYCNAEAIAAIRVALETIGITRTLLLRSSFSNGLHLYIPLPEAVSTFDLAVTLQECLKAQGMALAPEGRSLTIAKGQLEIFPNVKTYGVERIIHYNGHRLPLQPGTGSCLLDDGLNPISDSLERFFWLWDGAAAHQDMDELRHALKIGRDNHRKRKREARRPTGNRVEAWQQDMEMEIEEGWTGHGQTNHLLKVIACHGHVFLELEGDDLIAHTLATATHLSGYQQYCRHQHDIRIRVRAWCRAVQNYYWPLGSESKRDTRKECPPTPTINDQRAEDARQRIQSAMQALQAKDALPPTPKKRATAIAAEAGISSKTLYRSENLKLWHPEHCLELPEPREECKPTESTSVSAPKPPVNPVSTRLLKQRNSQEVYTLERFMKCKPDFEAGSEVRREGKERNRGVRGEVSRFPQTTSPDSVIYLEHYQPLPPLHPLASPEEQERHRNQEALRQCVFQLKWTHHQLSQYIAEQFEGRRFYQLMPDEVTMLVYRLRELLMNLFPSER